MAAPASSLQCRLMCAASSAYDICAKTGEFKPGQPHYDAVGYTATPTAISSKDKIDAALVGSNQDGLIISFRGTLGPNVHNPLSIKDWIQDVFMAAPEHVTGLPGKVHSGFWKAVSSIWDVPGGVLELVGDTTQDIYVTGHSKGGPMASIAAMLLNGVSGLKTPTVYTYASPKPGDAEFAAAYNEAISQTGYENHLDLVPFLVPSSDTIKLFEEIPEIGKLFKKAEGWNYEHVGKRLYIDRHGKVKSHSSDVIRMGEIVLKFVELQYKKVVQAHCHLCKSDDCAGGYMQGACEGTVCRPS